MTKIKDVAKLANVSTATVSRVLSNNYSATPKTRKKVMDAANKLDYHPNALGRQLRTMETKTILIVVPNITNPFFSNVLLGIESVAFENGFQVLLTDTQNQKENEEIIFELLRNKQVDGVILLTARTNATMLNQLSQDYPIVLACEYILNTKIPTVSIDNISSARKMTDHFFQLGHQRVAHITGPMEIVLGRDRLSGYKQSVLEHQPSVDPLLIQVGDYSYESGYQLMEKLLAIQQPPTAVFAASDEMAMGAIKAIKHQNKHVPNDVAVSGFDDIKMARIFEPTLTTISQPAIKIGNKSAQMLLNIINKKEIKKEHIVLEDQLKIRESCGSNIK
ncbi:LacI family transcriptional regulator [Salicibibacter halophilus]|uniref:LacI family transcriptional regulator n=1 Tax=Salicibibacter halophilus TaxID=2502791 RepID=A0A514LJA2_9BACI|nr:LacI family DNA-binding transcriptional regulator [Salicibibacter halophilus]QDI91928.1 LacI family transcriptional regulator [Salicibibacter halophilus]